MSEKYEPTYEDVAPQPGFFSLHYLYAIQSRRFRVEHGTKLRNHLASQRTELLCVDWATSGNIPEREEDQALYEEWADAEGRDTSPEALEREGARLRDDILTTLAHIALTRVRTDNSLPTPSPPYSLW